MIMLIEIKRQNTHLNAKKLVHFQMEKYVLKTLSFVVVVVDVLFKR